MSIKRKKLQKNDLFTLKKIVDVTIFVNAKTKIHCDKKHQSLLLQSRNKAYIQFHHDYKLSNMLNKKLKNQRIDSFLIKQRIDQLTYELNLFFN